MKRSQKSKVKSQKFWYLLLLISSLAYGISTSDIIKESKVYDGKSIIIEGEIIGKPMKRSNLYLFNISDGNFTIGVFINKMPKIRYYGRYGVIGDRVRVFGRFNVSCEKHWGKMDIHGLKMEVLEKGKLQEKPISKNKMFLLFALSLGAIFLILLNRKRGNQVEKVICKKEK